jgi:hypothetical protein
VPRGAAQARVVPVESTPRHMQPALPHIGAACKPATPG